jgi:hypothetical protein
MERPLPSVVRVMERKFSERVYTALLWEFMNFAKQRVWDTSFAETTVQMLEKSGDLNAADGRTLLARDEVLKVLQQALPDYSWTSFFETLRFLRNRTCSNGCKRGRRTILPPEGASAR